MQPVTYKWDRRSWYLPKDEDGNVTDEDITKVTRDGSKKDNGTHVGFLAQDVETLEQEIGFASDENNRLFTNLTEDGKRYGIKYERLVTVLVNAVKELNTKLEAAEARICRRCNKNAIDNSLHRFYVCDDNWSIDDAIISKNQLPHTRMQKGKESAGVNMAIDHAFSICDRTRMYND